MTDVMERPAARPGERSPSATSLRALDALNFFLADVRDGLGPFLGTYLREVGGWEAGRVGVALAASQIGAVLAQAPAGAFIDRTHRKRLAVALASVLVGAACGVAYFAPGFAAVVASQALTGAASTVFPPAVAALTLGLVGRPSLARRTGRNEAFNHAGNLAAAALAGGAAYAFGYGAMFLLAGLTAAASAAAALRIRAGDVDHDLARGADDATAAGGAVAVSSLLRDRRLVAFMASAVLFHFANAAMLPLVGQKAADGLTRGGAPLLMSACVIAAQAVMVPVALASSRLAATLGRKPVFLVGFATLPVRGLLYCLSVDPAYLVAVQLLDGIGAGIFGVVSVLVVADLTHGTGRFNLTQGVTAAATGVGAGLSNLLAGFVVEAAGFDAAFLLLAAVACVAALVFAATVPETLPRGPAATPL